MSRVEGRHPGAGPAQEMERFSQGGESLPAVEVTEAMVRLFAQVSGDHNPYHLDPEYARQSRYQRPIGHGILTVVLALSEISHRLPGWVPRRVEVSRFTAPVRFGDRVCPVVGRAQQDGDQWALPFKVVNQDDVDILHASVALRPRSVADGPVSWLPRFGQPLKELQAEALAWAQGVEPFLVRGAPAFAVGDAADYASVVSQERVKANVALSQDSPWVDQVLGMEAVAQASAEFAPGFILVGAELEECARPFQVGEPLKTRATITRHGTLAHRPLDRIRIEMEVMDARGDVVCRGAVYKESEASIGDAPESWLGPCQGVEFVAPATQRLLAALGRLRLPPAVAVLDLEGVAPGDRASAREAVAQFLTAMRQEQRDPLRETCVLLRLGGLRTEWAAGDLLEVVGQVGDALDGLVLSDVQGPEDVRVADGALAGLEEARGWERGRLKLEAVIQRAGAAEGATEIVGASSRLVGVVWALQKDGASGLAASLAGAAGRAGVDVIDGTTQPLDDGRTTALGALRAAMAGFHRKWALNPLQLNAVCNPQLYMSDRDMEQAGIPEEWRYRALAHRPEDPVLWGRGHTARPATRGGEGLLSLAWLQERAARGQPLL